MVFQYGPAQKMKRVAAIVKRNLQRERLLRVLPHPFAKLEAIVLPPGIVFYDQIQGKAFIRRKMKATARDDPYHKAKISYSACLLQGFYPSFIQAVFISCFFFHKLKQGFYLSSISKMFSVGTEPSVFRRDIRPWQKHIVSKLIIVLLCTA